MDDTKTRILEAALAQFAARGYEAVGVQDVCVASGITKPTLYYHFGSKKGLLEAIEGDRYRSFVEEVGAKGNYAGDVQASLLAVLKVFLESARRDADFSRLRLSLAFSPPDSEQHAVFRPTTEVLYKTIRSLFAAAAKDHGNMKGRDLPYAASFIGTADAYVGMLLAGSLDPSDAMVRRVVHHYMHGIFS
jgi:TetR/AcrR family transcriptional regulator